MNRPALRRIAALLLLPGALLSGALLAQETLQSLNERSTRVAQFLQGLDDRAQSCLDSIEAGATDSPACQRFMTAINDTGFGELLDDCDALMAWRDDFVNSNAGNVSATANTQANLQLLVDVDYYCTGNIMQRRTTAVIPAFNAMTAETRSQSGAISLLSQRFNDLEFRATEQRERQRLLNAIQQRQGNTREQTEDLLQDLEQELLRSQIDNQ